MIIAVAVDVTPLGGAVRVTVGTEVYPLPPELIMTLCTEAAPEPLPFDKTISVSGLNPEPFSASVKFFGLEIPIMGVIVSL